MAPTGAARHRVRRRRRPGRPRATRGHAPPTRSPRMMRLVTLAAALPLALAAIPSPSPTPLAVDRAATAALRDSVQIREWTVPWENSRPRDPYFDTTTGDVWFVGQVGNYVARLNPRTGQRSEEHTSELQSPCNLVCRLLLEKKQRA